MLPLLELFHPNGCAEARVYGSGRRTGLPAEAPSRAAALGDLVVLAPSAAECQTAGWLAAAAAEVAHSLTRDGLGYVLAARPWRLPLSRLLRERGLVIELALGHLPDWATSAYLVPLADAPVRHFFSHIATGPWAKRLAGLYGLHVPGAARLLAYTWPSAGLVVRRPGARPLFEWAFPVPDRAGAHSSVLIRRSWRDGAGATVLFCFPSGARHPAAVAKLWPKDSPAGGPACEAEALQRLGPAARQAGAAVPQPVRLAASAAGEALVQTPILGRAAAALLRSRPQALPALMERLVAWLERWHQTTRAAGALSPGRLNADLLAPAALLAPQLEQGEAYLNWLRARCQAAEGAGFSWVAAHNDLSMDNVLYDARAGLGVVDWAEGRADGWPLADFYYALTDAAMTALKLDRAHAFRACFGPDGRLAEQAAAWQARLASAAQVPPNLAALAFQACWLRHAANERQAAPVEAPRPFLSILQAAARQALLGAPAC